MYVANKFETLILIACCISILVFAFTALALIRSENYRGTDGFIEALKNKTIRYILIITTFFIVIGFSYSFILSHIIQRRLTATLKSFIPATDKIFVNDVNAEDKTEEIARDLAELKSIHNHRPSLESHKITVVIRGEKVKLLLTKSLYDSTVYRVYYTKPGLFEERHVGEIRTTFNFNKPAI